MDYRPGLQGRGKGEGCNDNVFAVSRLVTLGGYLPARILYSVGNLLLDMGGVFATSWPLTLK